MTLFGSHPGVSMVIDKSPTTLIDTGLQASTPVYNYHLHSTAAKKEGRSLVRGNQIGLRRLRLRRLRFVREQFLLAAVAQNIKRPVRFLSQPTAQVLPATT
jgi:hypothetical protein